PVGTIADLLRAAADGDSAAREELFHSLQPRVSTLVHSQIQRRLRRSGHPALARLSTGDVVQDVFLEVLRGLERWEGEDDEAFLGLLATLVEHRLLDQIRHHQADRRDVRRHADVGPLTAGVGHDVTPSLAAAGDEVLRIYREELATFVLRERALLALRLEDGLEFKAVAERLAYPSTDAARKAFHAAQARLLLRLRRRGVSLPGGGDHGN
ncbi:MAG: RNA polymerase sigma factor, partial [Planctomycetota bacterium]